MSEEEKRAIKWLKELYDIEKDFNSSAGKEESNIVKTLINLIEKQQKEIEQVKKFGIPIETLCAEFERLENLEDKTDELKMEIEEKEQTIKILRKTKPIEEVFHDLIKEKDYISKDKIREKIKELEITRNSCVTDNGFTIMSVVISNFKELLEEN